MRAIRVLGVGCLCVALSACGNFIKRAEYDSTIAELRNSDAELRATDEQLSGANMSLREQLERMEFQMGQLTDNLQTSFASYDAQIAHLQGRIRVDMTAHFAVNDTALQENDKEALREFSQTISDYHPNIIVTVEGFTDPSGSAEYNKWLGMERAKSVREYLVSNGLPADKVRAVSYGEDKERQISPGATGENGLSNRRVALVIDYIVS